MSLDEFAPTSAHDRSRFTPERALIDDENLGSVVPSTPPLAEASGGGSRREPEEAPDRLDDRARAYAAWGRYGCAKRLHERAVELRRRDHGEADPRLLQSLMWLGGLATREGRLEEARWLYMQVRELATQRRGPESPLVARALNNLAVVARRQGDRPGALECCERALALKTARGGAAPLSLVATLINLGGVCREASDLRGALACFERARALLEDAKGRGAALMLASALVGLGRVQGRLGASDAACFTFERALDLREANDAPPGQLVHARLLVAQALLPRRPQVAHALALRAFQEYSLFAGDPTRTEGLGRWLSRFELACAVSDAARRRAWCRRQELSAGLNV